MVYLIFKLLKKNNLEADSAYKLNFNLKNVVRFNLAPINLFNTTLKHPILCPYIYRLNLVKSFVSEHLEAKRTFMPKCLQFVALYFWKFEDESSLFGFAYKNIDSAFVDFLQNLVHGEKIVLNQAGVSITVMWC